MFRSIADNPFLLLVLVLVIVLIFGSKRLPDAARSMGRSMKIFKSEMKDLRSDDDEKPKPGTPNRPIEGRVVDERHGDTPRTADEQHRADEPHRGA
jgi:sec-independent protein translocase protein TatA